jgi:hypothetical protein
MRATAALILLFACSACDVSSIDPTEATFDVRVENDLGTPAVVALCADDKCNHLSDSFTLQPSETNTVGAAAAATNTYAIKLNGRRIGCLILTYKDKPNRSPSVPLSHSSTCPH